MLLSVTVYADGRCLLSDNLNVPHLYQQIFLFISSNLCLNIYSDLKSSKCLKKLYNEEQDRITKGSSDLHL